MSGGNPTDDGLPFLLRRKFTTVEFAQREGRTVKAMLDIDQPEYINDGAVIRVPLRCHFAADMTTAKESRVPNAGPKSDDLDKDRFELFAGKNPAVMRDATLVAGEGSILAQWHDQLNEQFAAPARISIKTLAGSDDSNPAANWSKAAANHGVLALNAEIDVSRLPEGQRPSLDIVCEKLSAAATAAQYEVDRAMPETVAFKPKDDSGVGRMVGDAVDAAEEPPTVSFAAKAAEAKAALGSGGGRVRGGTPSAPVRPFNPTDGGGNAG